jgi:site-specific recombinase XerD
MEEQLSPELPPLPACLACYVSEEAMAVRDDLRRFLMRYSGSSYKAYSSAISHWIEHRTEGRLFKDHSLLHVKRTDAEHYIRLLAESDGMDDGFGNKKKASKSIKAYHSILRTFYQFLIDAGSVSGPNPFAFKVKLQENRKREYECIPDEDVIKILMSFDVSNKAGRRDRAVISSLLYMGMRCSEPCGIAIGDLYEHGGLLKIRIRRQKNKKRSELPIPDGAREALLAVWQDRIDMGAKDSEPLFVHYHAKTTRPLSPKYIYRLFLEAQERAKLRKRYTPHSARATAITKLLELGYDPIQVMAFSRHSSVAMVLIYDKRRLADRDHPGLKVEYATGKKAS